MSLWGSKLPQMDELKTKSHCKDKVPVANIVNIQVVVVVVFMIAVQ